MGGKTNNMSIDTYRYEYMEIGPCKSIHRCNYLSFCDIIVTKSVFDHVYFLVKWEKIRYDFIFIFQRKICVCVCSKSGMHLYAALSLIERL